MEEHDLPSEDSSDEDYVPGGVASDVSSEESECDVEGSGGEETENKNVNGKKRGKCGTKKKSRKKKKLKTEEGVKETEENLKDIESPKPVENEEEQKKKADVLWQDFIKDCGATSKTVQDQALPDSGTTKVTEEKENNSETGASLNNKVKITQIFDFAGEKVQVEKEVKKEDLPPVRGSFRGGRRGGGLSAVLGAIGKKSKLSTLEKSKLDWEKFKSQEGINEDILKHNKGKNGYLEKQDFLDRTDFRQFELEKEMRLSSRSNR